MDCGSNAENPAGNPYRAIPFRGWDVPMSGEATVPSLRASEFVSCQGISLVLGYHPRANLDLVIGLCVSVALEGQRSLIMDCDRTVTLDILRSRLEEGEISRILLSHPEDAISLNGDVVAANSVKDVGILVINRPSSLVKASDLIGKFEEKKRLWHLLYRSLIDISKRCPVLILEDSRRIDQIEYKIHPALYYLSETILDAAEDGKKVQQYQIVKRRVQEA